MVIVLLCLVCVVAGGAGGYLWGAKVKAKALQAEAKVIQAVVPAAKQIEVPRPTLGVRIGK